MNTVFIDHSYLGTKLEPYKQNFRKAFLEIIKTRILALHTCKCRRL